MKNEKIIKIALINDISGYGNCSLTACIPILTALGFETHPLITAVLSNQTGYDSYHMIDLSSSFDYFLDEWAKIGEKIDYIYSGFILNHKCVEKIVSYKQQKNSKLLIDPVLGDNGKLYKCIDENIVYSYIGIIKEADYITPNLTEACLLTQSDYKKYSSFIDKNDFNYKIFELLKRLKETGSKKVIITGIYFKDYIYTAYYDGEKANFIKSKKLSKNYSGTGDVFASLFLGYILKGYNDISSIKKATKIISKSIKISLKNNTNKNHGIDICKIIKNL